MTFNPQFQKVGDILVYQNIITKDELEKALQDQKESNEKLGQILINQKVLPQRFFWSNHYLIFEIKIIASKRLFGFAFLLFIISFAVP